MTTCLRLARLPAGLFWRLVHVGGGPLAARLNQQAERLGLCDRIEWRGRARNPMFWRHTVRPTFRARGENRQQWRPDGLPNVLLEAQSQRLACVATRLSGIPD